MLPELCEVKGMRDGGLALDIKLFKLGQEQNAEFDMHKTILAHFTYQEYKNKIYIAPSSS